MTTTADPAGADPTAGLNLVVVRGRLSSDPTDRTLPSGDVVWNYEVTVRPPEGRAESIPVVLGRGAPPRGLSAGDEVLVLGRVRRRFFRSGGRTASRTEVVADRIVRATRTAAVRSGLSDAVRVLAEHDGPTD